MTTTINSANMNMPVPVVGQDPGPQWATDVNSCFGIIDQHDHTSGYGVPITPLGLNINSDLTFNSHNLITARSVRFNPYTSIGTFIPTAADLGCLLEVGVDLYYIDGSGNQIRITQSGSVAGASGTITGLPSGTASASYNSISGTFVFQSATLTPANIDGASFILRNNTASSKGLTLSPPSAMGADFTLTLPSKPGATSFVTLDSSGGFGASVPISLGITTSMIANSAVTAAKLLSTDSYTMGNLTVGGTISLGGNLSLTGIVQFAGGVAVARYNATTNTVAVSDGTTALPVVVGGTPTMPTGLRILRGTVDSSGLTPNPGEGWVPTPIVTGRRRIAFAIAFADVPSVTVSPVFNAFLVNITSVSTTNFEVAFYDTAPLASGSPIALTDTAFSFIAAGPR